MKNLIAVLILTIAALGQTVSNIPRPFVYGGLDLGNGPAYIGGVGVLETSPHFLFSGEASYDNDRKSDDNVNIHPNGHDRRFQGSAYYDYKDWFFGGGARWAKEYTLAYTKEQWHPTVGFGTDYITEFFSTRIQMDYILPYGSEHVSHSGCDVPKGQCTNDVQGPSFKVFFPSPKTRSHFFFRAALGTYWGHETVTSTDPELTRKQKGDIIPVSEFQMTLMYRF